MRAVLMMSRRSALGPRRRAGCGWSPARPRAVSDQIIITGKAGAPQASASAPRYSVWPGYLKPGLVERGLGDRVGHHRAGLAVTNRFDRALDRFDRRRGVGRRWADRARPRPGFSSATTGNAVREGGSGSRRIGLDDRRCKARALRRRRPGRSGAGENEERERRASGRARRPAPAPGRCPPDRPSSSPAGPCRRSCSSSKGGFAVGRSEADVCPDVAERAQRELNHQRLVARRRIIKSGTARER